MGLRLLYPLPWTRRLPLAARRRARRSLTARAVHPHLRRCREVRLAAVTGSMGKTTTKDLLGAMLATAGPTVVTRENDNGLYGVPATLLSIHPDDSFAVVEAGVERPGDMRWMASLVEPEVAVLTGIGQDHLAAFGTPGRIAAEKRALLERVPSSGTVVVNADDPRAVATAAATGRRTTTAGRAAGADVRIAGTRLHWPVGLEVSLAARGRVWTVQTQLLGEHQALPVALAFAAALDLGAEPADAAAAAARVPPRPGRLSRAPGPGGSLLLLDEHKSRPATALAALRALADVPAVRRIAVLGDCQDVGALDESTLEAMDDAAREHADLIIRVGSATGAATRPSEAARAVPRDLGPGDVVLVHGALRQHLLRVALHLDGRAVGCDVARCRLHWRCTACPHLVPGPPDRVVEAY